HQSEGARHRLRRYLVPARQGLSLGGDSRADRGATGCQEGGEDSLCGCEQPRRPARAASMAREEPERRRDSDRLQLHMEPFMNSVIEEAQKAGKGIVAMKVMAGGLRRIQRTDPNYARLT